MFFFWAVFVTFQNKRQICMFSFQLYHIHHLIKPIPMAVLLFMSAFDIDVPIRKHSLPSPTKLLERKKKIHTDIYLYDGSSHSFTSSSEDDIFLNHNYDADDEIDGYLYEENNNEKYFCPSEDDDELFCFSQNKQGTIYSLERALELIQDRPKLTDRFFSPVEDSDDCFHESEYDVINSEDDLDLVDIVDDDSYPKAAIPIIRFRSSSFTEGDGVSIATTPASSKNKLKTGKVKSLPNIRFPIRHKKCNVARSITFHGMADIYKRTLKKVKEQEELTTTSGNERNKTDKIDDMYLSPCGIRRSESESQQVTSDADYLTTIHGCQMSNNCYDTNVDTQAEDAEPIKFYDFFKKRSRKRSLSRVMSLKDRLMPLITPVEQRPRANTTIEGRKGRFTISSIRVIPTEDDMLLNSVELSSASNSPLQNIVSSTTSDLNISDVTITESPTISGAQTEMNKLVEKDGFLVRKNNDN